MELIRGSKNALMPIPHGATQQRHRMPYAPVIDPHALENLRSLSAGDNDEFLREITGIFLEDTPARIIELTQSLVRHDLASFTRAAHSIKGSAANLGAVKLRAVAEKLEHQARVKGLDGVHELVAQLKAEYARTQRALGELVGR